MILKGRELYWNWNNKFSNYGNGNTYLKANEFRKLVNTTRDSITKLSKENKIEEGDKVYFHSSSTIPRYKFNNYAQDKKISRVIKLDKATKVVVNLDNLIFKIKTTYTYPTDFILLPYDFFSSRGIKTDGFNINQNEFFLVRDYIYRNIRDSFNKTGYSLPDASTLTRMALFNAGDGGVAANNFIKELNEIKAEHRYVEDKTLNEQMGDEFPTIDENNYDEYNDMLKAKDEQTFLTGLELISNTNYKNSTFYVSLLLNGNINRINMHPNKSVNVKNFLDYFKDIKWQENVPNFLSSLRKRLKKENALDETKDKYIHKNMLDYANKCISHAGIVVSQIEFKD